MDFELSEDQRLLAKTVASFAAKESDLGRARRLRDDPRGWEPAVWKKMGELGWLGVPFSEEAGGFGGSFVEAALVLEQLATTLVPEPYLASVVVAGSVVEAAGTPAQRAALLGPMIEGESSLALAYAEREGRYDHASPSTVARRDGEGYRLDGEKVWVLNGNGADRLVVSASLDGALALFAVDVTTKGLGLTRVRTIDGRGAAHVRLDGVRVGSEGRLAEGDAASTLERALDRGAAGAVAEGLGVARAMLAMTTEYLKTREQFGVKIGSFQALQHRAADMFVETELLRSIDLEAMIRVDGADDAARRRTVSAAKVQLAESGQFVARQSVQLHGGVGVTDEHDIGLYFKRQVVLDALFGDAEHHTARFALSAR